MIASLVSAFTERLLSEVRALKVGDPMNPETDVGTVVDEAAAQRIESWVQDAKGRGASVLIGGSRSGAQMQPTVLTNVTQQMKVVCEEVFGPVMSIRSYDDIDAVIAEINATPYGLQTGIYTQALDVAFKAIRTIKTGGVIVGGTSTWRTDQLPYGGVKNSGIGREGPRYAIREMTDERLVVFNL